MFLFVDAFFLVFFILVCEISQSFSIIVWCMVVLIWVIFVPVFSRWFVAIIDVLWVFTAD